MTTAVETNVPALRFPEFFEDWEKKKLSEVTVSHNGKRIPLSDDQRRGLKKTYPYYGASGIIDYVDRFLFDGEYILLGEDGANILSRSVRLSFLAKGKFWVNNHAHIFQAKENYSNFFIAESLERLEYDIYNTGTVQPKLNSKVVSSIPIFIPSLPEQQKIASFLTAIDAKIELLTKKKFLLEQYKKGVMQQLFSQQIRFKDDEGNEFPEWEEKKLEQIGTVTGGGTPDTAIEKYWNGGVQWFTPTELKTKYVNESTRTISPAGVKSSSSKLLPKGTVLFSSRATVGDVSIALRECTTNQGFQSIITNKSNYNEFIYYWLSNNKKIFLRKASGSIFLEINKTEFSKIKINMPSLLEQKKIAGILKTVDVKIDTICSQIEKTDLFKKGLLQQLFV